MYGTNTNTLKGNHTDLVNYVDTWRNSHYVMHTNTILPTGVVQSSECLPVITTAIDQSHQRKLEVDWPGCCTEKWRCFSDCLLFLSLFLFCYYSLLYPGSFLSAFLILHLQLWDLFFPALHPHPCFFFLGSSFVSYPCEATVLLL